MRTVGILSLALCWTLGCGSDPLTPAVQGESWVRIQGGGSLPVVTPDEVPCGQGANFELDGLVFSRGPTKIDYSFMMLATEVTREQWREVMGDDHAALGPATEDFLHPDCRGACPVFTVSMADALRYCNALSEARGLASCYSVSDACQGGLEEDCQFSINTPSGDVRHCKGIRLPTFWEWEYATRAGTTTHTYAGDLSCETVEEYVQGTQDIGWCMEDEVSPVATKEANPWGLYDTLGNARELVHRSASDPWTVMAGGGFPNTGYPSCWAFNVETPSGEWFADGSSLQEVAGLRPVQTAYGRNPEVPEVGAEGCTPVVGCHGEDACAEHIGDGWCDWSLVCAEHTLDGGDCCEGDAIESCDDGYYLCPEWLTELGDGECDRSHDCERLDHDGGDCACPEGELLSWCGAPWTTRDGEAAADYQTCKPASGLGDGVCDAWFDCSEHSYDHKDCDYDYILYEDDWCTALGMVMDCHNSGCLPPEYIEAHIGNGVCDFQLNCPRVGGDGDDCDEVDFYYFGPVAGAYSEDCQGHPVPYHYQQDLEDNGFCDASMNCVDRSFDDGDCGAEASCAEGEVAACDGSCVSAGKVGDGQCDELLRCEALEFDKEDCEMSWTSWCDSVGLAAGCQGYCVDPQLAGDGVCNKNLHCEEFDYDGGDCWDAPWCAESSYWAASTWFTDTSGVTGCGKYGTTLCEPLKAVDDGLCDYNLDCEHHDNDSGDCACEDPDQARDCNGVCTDVAWQGDGTCDGNIDECRGDNEDCRCEDDAEYNSYKRNCDGGCVMDTEYWSALEAARGNGVCDQAFNCHVSNWDGGECGAAANTTTGCETKDQIPDCTGVCTDRTPIGDGTCDEAFNCWSFGYDNRDCPQP